ncbi:ecotin [Comamonas flocculans]|uniref:Ecotin n=2 Tax=Comamonas flocculans TaxID=2597701 RepID=A0A5B8RX94_9BURK|nr:ecotin [Comamonas flocculans]
MNCFSKHLQRAAWPCLAVLLTACAAQPMPASTDLAKELKAFPAALPGHQRHVIELPALADESTRKLELIGGKAMTLDCNARGMDGGFEAQDVPGWGYTYWVLKSQGQVRSTMMMCPPGTEKPGFVQAEPLLLRYNSKLPVVVFVPQGMQLRWRVWQAGELQQAPVR